jgi:hypothetical protein
MQNEAFSFFFEEPLKIKHQMWSIESLYVNLQVEFQTVLFVELKKVHLVGIDFLIWLVNKSVN